MNREDILNCFKDDMCYADKLQNKQERINDGYGYTIGIFTNNYDKCCIVFNKLVKEHSDNIKYFIDRKFEKRLYLDNEIEYRWLEPSHTYIKGNRTLGAYIDEDITDKDEIMLILHVCQYCMIDDIKFI